MASPSSTASTTWTAATSAWRKNYAASVRRSAAWETCSPRNSRPGGIRELEARSHRPNPGRRRNRSDRTHILALQRQVLVNERDRHASLAHPARHPFDRLMPHVARAKKPRKVRLQQERRPALLPELEVAPGADIAVLVPLQPIRQPARIGIGSNHHEQRIRLPRPRRRAPRAGANRLQMVFPARRHHHRKRLHRNIALLLH